MIAVMMLIAKLEIILFYTTVHSHIGLSEYQLSLLPIYEHSIGRLGRWEVASQLQHTDHCQHSGLLWELGLLCYIRWHL